MWFKNLNVYRFNEPFTPTGEMLEAKLQEATFHRCGAHDMSSYGFISALGAKTKALVHQNNGCMLIRTRKEEQILPAEVIKEKLAEKIEQIEEEQDRQVFAKEKKALKDDIIRELLPQAFTRSKYTQAYIDPVTGLLIVNGSAKQAEELTSKLREALGSLPISLPYNRMPCDVMHGWLDTGEPPGSLVFGDVSELREPGDEGGQLKAKQMDLTSQPIQNHLDDMLVSALMLTWQDAITFTLKEDLRLIGVTITDILQAERDTVETQTKVEALDADFALMSLYLRKFLPQLISYLN